MAAQSNLDEFGNPLPPTIGAMPTDQFGNETGLSATPTDPNDTQAGRDYYSPQAIAARQAPFAGNQIQPLPTTENLHAAGIPLNPSQLASGAAVAAFPPDAPWLLPILAGGGAAGLTQMGENKQSNQPVMQNVPTESAWGAASGALLKPLQAAGEYVGQGIAKMGASPEVRSLLNALGAKEGSAASMTLPDDINQIIDSSLKKNITAGVPTAQDLAEKGVPIEDIPNQIKKLQQTSDATTNDLMSLSEKNPKEFYSATRNMPGDNIRMAGVAPYQVGSEAKDTLLKMAQMGETGSHAAGVVPSNALALLRQLAMSPSASNQ